LVQHQLAQLEFVAGHARCPMPFPAARHEGRSSSPPARSPSREVVSRSCHALGRSHEAGKFIEYLQSQWIEDLSELTDQDWRELQLPLGLKSQMRRQVSCAEESCSGASPTNVVRNGDLAHADDHIESRAAPTQVSPEKAEDTTVGTDEMARPAGNLATMQRTLANHCSLNVLGFTTGLALFSVSVSAMIVGFGDIFSLRDYIVGLYNCFYAGVIILCNAHGNGSGSRSSKRALVALLQQKWRERVDAVHQRLLGAAPFLGDPRGLAFFYVHVGLQLLVLQPETFLWRALFIVVGCLLAILVATMVCEARAKHQTKSIGDQYVTERTDITVQEGHTVPTHRDGCGLDGCCESRCGSKEAEPSFEPAACCNSEGGQSGCCTPPSRTRPASDEFGSPLGQERV